MVGPDVLETAYWPTGIPREETLEAFVNAFATLGYEVEGDQPLEFVTDRIAVFVTPDGTPTHAARQLPSGGWTSKLGSWEDIGHVSISGIEGGVYGRVACILKRAAR